MKFAAFRRIWPAPALALALVAGGTAVPASADTPIPLPLPGISLSLNAPVPAPAPSVGALEATLFTKLNAERAAAGLGALALQPWASSVARIHSLEMAAARDIWHNHTGYLDIARQAIRAYLSGENVAEAGTLDEADGLLMNSAPHRANILYPAFNHVGIGVAIDPVGYVYVTQDFVMIKPGPAAAIAAGTPSGGPAGAPAGKAARTPAAAPVPSPSMAKPAAPAATAAPVPQLSPLAAVPVATTGRAIRRLEGRLGFIRRLEGRLGPTSLPAVVWAIVLAALGARSPQIRSPLGARHYSGDGE